MQKNQIVLILLLFFSAFMANAQKGIVRGTVYEEETGETLLGVAVAVQGTTMGAITDFDGKFELRLDPGTYTIEASFVSFQKVAIQDVQVVADEVTLLNQIWMREDVQQLEAVVITAEVIRNSETALMTVKKKSASLMDGISSANFSKIGDSDAASAVKRVTGVSVEGGKYVFVRGLGDRYTKTTLNNVDIPGLDPDRNSIQMDIFPTNLISNMLVLKSATADMPADFTGGVVNIETKDFPDEKQFSVSLGATYNPSMHFNGDHLTYSGGSTDWLGMDDGTRALPDGARLDPIPSFFSGHTEAEVSDFNNSFSSTLGAIRENSFMNYSLGISYADQKSLSESKKLGYIVSASYKSTSEYFDDVEFGEYQVNPDESEYEMIASTLQEGEEGRNSVLMGALAGVALKTENSKIKLTAMHLQNGESKAGVLEKENVDDVAGQSGYVGRSHQLYYTQRALSNIMLNGVHHSEDAKWKIDWRVSPTISKIDEPDIRRTPYTFQQGDTIISPGANGAIERSWRYLDEINLVGKVDVTKEYMLQGRESKLKFGVSHVFKERDYEILQYSYNISGLLFLFPNTDPNTILTEENVYPGPFSLQSGNNDPNPNQYNSVSNNTSIYVSNEFSPTEKLKAIVGLRAENFVMEHTGRNDQAANYISNGGDPADIEAGLVPDAVNLDGDEVLNSLDLFPSVNLIYALQEEQNLRASYGRTIARPSFKEMSFAQIIDPINNRIFNGGLIPIGDWDGNLQETYINNLDLRWEMFLPAGQLLSVSTFYKTFENPIEIVRLNNSPTSVNFQPQNVGNGTLYGLEFELRKSLDFASPALENLSLVTNMTFVKSQIKMSEAERSSREAMLRDGESLESTRPMAGQAPYIINAGLSYDNGEIGLDAGLFYNVKGPTLMIVAASPTPDVYAEPFHSLNFNMNKSFGPEERAVLTFSISNILNDDQEEVFKSYKADDQIFSRYTPGTSIGVGFKYSF